MEIERAILNKSFEEFQMRIIHFDVDWSYLRLSSINDIIYSKMQRIKNYHKNSNSNELIKNELIEVLLNTIIGLFQISTNNVNGKKLDKEVVLLSLSSKKNEIADHIISFENTEKLQSPFEMLNSEVLTLHGIENDKVQSEDYFRVLNKVLFYISKINDKI